LHKPVVWLVPIECLDRVIAIPPSVGTDLVGLEALAFGKAGEIEPMAAPALAVLRRSQEAVHRLFDCLGRAVGQECVYFLWCGRQTDEIETDAADERDSIRGRAWRDVLGLQFGQDELVNGISDPRRIMHSRRGLLFNLLKRP